MKLNEQVNGIASMTSATTTPPPLFTDGDLVDVMKNIADYIQMGKEARADLSGGIGTSRTRLPIIKGQFDKGFVIAVKSGKKKVIHPTEKGLMIFEAATESTPELCSPKLTSEFDSMLTRVANGDLGFEDFIDKQAKFTTYCIDKIKQNNPQAVEEPKKETKPISGHGEACDKCKKGKMVTRYSSKHEKYFLACDATKKVKDKWTGCDNTKFPESEGWISKK